LAKLVRATSGISLTDIQRRGLLGGDNSELRKITQAITGGPNSAVNEALRAADRVLDPTKWKIEIPPIKFPDIPVPKFPDIPVPKLPTIRF
jgi:hypothetical protein